MLCQYFKENILFSIIYQYYQDYQDYFINDLMLLDNLNLF